MTVTDPGLWHPQIPAQRFIHLIGAQTLAETHGLGPDQACGAGGGGAGDADAVCPATTQAFDDASNTVP